MYPDDFAYPLPRATPQQAVDEYELAIEELQEAQGRLAGHVDGCRRLFRPRAPKLRDLEVGITDAEWQLKSATNHLEEVGVGHRPQAWGVLSGVGRVSLGQTLRDYLGHYKNADPYPIHDLQSRVCQARLAAHAGDRLLEEGVEEDVARLAIGVEDERLRRRLISHLPSNRRPRARSMKEVQRHTDKDHLNMWSTWKPARTVGHIDLPNRITLHDIVVPTELRGQGLGAAALLELCRYADEHDAEIKGTMVPGGEDLDEEPQVRKQRLRGWYERHGFSVGPDNPQGAQLRRLPRAVA